jgi:hypothetical protein
MKKFCIVLGIVFIASTVMAKDVFTDKDRKELTVLEIQEGKAIIQDLGGRKVEIEVGDSIGKDRGVVVEIEKGAIVIEQDNSRARVPLHHTGVVREITVSR